MKMRAIPVLSRRRLHRMRAAQVGLIMGFWLAGEALVRLVHLPVPGGIVGLALLLAAMAAGWISPFSARRGAQCLLADMLLFFVPAVPAVVEHGEFVGILGLKILAVILVGTVAVMAATALTVDACHAWMLRRARTGAPPAAAKGC